MGDAALVRRRESAQNPKADLDDFPRRHRPRRDARRAASSRQQLRDDVGDAAFGADVVERDNVRMIERGGRARLLLEAGDAVGIGGDDLGQNLDGDIAMQAAVAGSVDLAHSANAENTQDRVRAQLRARGNGHVDGIVIAADSSGQPSRPRKPGAGKDRRDTGIVASPLCPTTGSTALGPSQADGCAV